MNRGSVGATGEQRQGAGARRRLRARDLSNKVQRLMETSPSLAACCHAYRRPALHALHRPRPPQAHRRRDDPRRRGHDRRPPEAPRTPRRARPDALRRMRHAAPAKMSRYNYHLPSSAGREVCSPKVFSDISVRRPTSDAMALPTIRSGRTARSGYRRRAFWSANDGEGAARGLPSAPYEEEVGPRRQVRYVEV
jgi:hypothetical protein